MFAVSSALRPIIASVAKIVIANGILPETVVTGLLPTLSERAFNGYLPAYWN